MRIALCIGVFMIIIGAQAQDEKDIASYIPTENLTGRKDFNKKRHRPDRQKIRYIVKNSGANILYGNPCWIEETHKMGFEYVVQKQGLAGSMKPIRKTWENLKTHMVLILTKSPLWKAVLNKRIKNCRQKSGDLVG